VVTRRPWSRAAAFAGRLHELDVRDTAALTAAVRPQSIVFDFVGASAAIESNRDPKRSLDEDCRAQLSVFQSCARARSAVVVFCSSRLVYGKPRYLPVDETHPLSPESFYAVHRIAAENYLRVLGSTEGLRWCVLRLSNPYGSFEPVREKSHCVINRFLADACSGKFITVFGDGLQERDYIYVEDAITAFLRCAMTEAAYGEIFNVGAQARVSVASAARTIARLAGSPGVRFVPWPGEYRLVETGNYSSDLTKLRQCLGIFNPVTFEEGIAKSIEHYNDGSVSAPLILEQPHG
jgi:nucleoside-diphosphate-sugar epimerase